MYKIKKAKKIVRTIKHNFLRETATFRKNLNYLKSLWNFNYKKKIVLSHYPTKLSLDTGPICNLNCFLCPVGERRSGRKQGFLKREVVEKVIKELGPYLNIVYLFCWGEPFLHKEIFEFVRLFKKANIRVYVSSNLNIFNDEICREIVDSGIDKLEVSLHGGSDKSLDKHQRGSKFEQVVTNMKKIVEYKKLKGVKHPVIIWCYKATRFNEAEIEASRRISKEISIDEFHRSTIGCDIGKKVLLDDKAQFSNVEPFLPIDESLSRYDYKEKKKKKYFRYCSWLYNFAAINWDGLVSPCCATWEESYDFGNILETPFKKIWNNKKFQLARKVIKSKNAKVVPGLICSYCKKNNALFTGI